MNEQVYKQRLEKLSQHMKEAGLDVLLLTKPSNMFYLTGDGRLCAYAMITQGGQVALGTDFEGYYTPFQLGMPTKEIAWMSEAGKPPMHIIIAATKNAARVSNVEHDLGTLEAGKIADVLIVKRNPLQNLQALSDVLYVIHNGEVIREP